VEKVGRKMADIGTRNILKRTHLREQVDYPDNGINGVITLLLGWGALRGSGERVGVGIGLKTASRNVPIPVIFRLIAIPARQIPEATGCIYKSVDTQNQSAYIHSRKKQVRFN
jgi:hypothetical protein